LLDCCDPLLQLGLEEGELLFGSLVRFFFPL
jgi:hypothetical protein